MITLNKKIHNDLHYDGFCLIPRDELDIDIIETTKKLAEQILNLPQLSSFYSKNKIDNLSNLQEVISLINDVALKLFGLGASASVCFNKLSKSSPPGVP